VSSTRWRVLLCALAVAQARGGLAYPDGNATQRPVFWSGGREVVVAHEPVRIDDKVYFQANEPTLDPRYGLVLDELVAALHPHPVLHLRVVGHADPKEGPDALTQLLALDRADGVRDLLIARGLDADRVTVQGQGESQPVAPSSGRQGRAGNRRVEFDVVPTEPPTPEPTLSEEQPLPEGPPVPEGD
jgi:outer membrane protein OmpA-like peptidoglycan-associated protein